jgi:thiol:disulfide interchange protein DsbC
MTLRFVLSLALAGASLSACAQSTLPAAGQDAKAADTGPQAAASAADPKVAPGTAAARALAALKKVNANIVPDQITDAPIAGFQQAIVAGQVVYVSNDGKYLMQGSLYDIDAQQNLGEAAMASVRRELLQSIPASDRIVFAPANPKYTVVVFTDVECGFCRKMHGEIADYNKQGIAVEYVAFPRMGLASEDFKKMEAVWCAKDRRKALTDAKNDRKVPAGRCKNPVAMQYNLGQRAGLTGTPMILAEDGTQLGGYTPAVELRAALDKHAGQATGQAQAAATPSTGA